jgi:nicotinamidase-related amidase
MATPMNVLVVIDVQNCFMFHKDGMAEGKGGTFLNAGEEASAEIVKELETLVDGKTHVVFSRDFHPVNHISLEGYEGRSINPLKGVWPKHCRNKSVRCGAQNWK